MSHPLIRIVPVSLAVGVLVAAAAVTHPSDATGQGTAPIEAKLPPVQTALVCPPPPSLAQGAEAAGTDTGFAAQPVAPVSTLSAFTYRAAGEAPSLSAYLLPTQSESKALDVKASGPLNALSGAQPAPVWLSAAPDAQGSPPIGALATTLTTEGDLAGLAASTCTPADSAGWLVGGGVAAGRSGRIVLSNPGATPVTVDLHVLTSAGPEAPPSGQDVVVAPGSSRQLLLEGLLSTPGPVAIGYSASGGQIAANLVDSQLAGITPRGVEQIPAIRPSSKLVIAGVRAVGTSHLRLANPGTDTAEITWRFIGPDGTIASATEAGAAVPAGQVSDVAITVPAGAVAIEISSKTAVLGSVVTTAERDSPTGRAADDAVLTPGAPLGSGSLVATGPVATAVTLVAGNEPATVELRQVDGNGTPVVANQTVALPADTARAMTLAPGAAVALIEVRAGSVHGGLWLSAGDASQFVAGAPIQPAATSQESVAVQVARRP